MINFIKGFLITSLIIIVIFIEIIKKKIIKKRRISEASEELFKDIRE